jgi:hypothetical protein
MERCRSLLIKVAKAAAFPIDGKSSVQIDSVKGGTASPKCQHTVRWRFQKNSTVNRFSNLPFMQYSKCKMYSTTLLPIYQK